MPAKKKTKATAPRTASAADKTSAVFDGLPHNVIARRLQKMAKTSDPTVVRKLKLLNEDKALPEFASCNVFRESRLISFGATS